MENDTQVEVSKPSQTNSFLDTSTAHQIVPTSKLAEQIKKKVNEIVLKKKHKKKQQRLAMYANIKERIIDTVFEAEIFTRAIRAKIQKQETDKAQQMYMKSIQLSRPRVNQMILSKKENLFEKEDQFQILDCDFTEIESYLEYQSSKNILDRVEKKEMQLLQSSSEHNNNHIQSGNLNSSLNLNQSTNLSFQSFQANNNTFNNKYVFPFENFQPTYTDSDLQQLFFEEDQEGIDAGLANSKHFIVCFTFFNDTFALSLSSGVLRVKNLLQGTQYDVTYHLHHHNSSYTSRGKDITCLQLLPDEQHLLASHESGALSMYDYKQNKFIFFMKNIFKYSSSILDAFVRENSSLSILDMKLVAQNIIQEEFFVIISNARGDCILARIQNGFLSHSSEIIYLMKHELFPLTQITVLNEKLHLKHFLNNVQSEEKKDQFVVAITSPEKLFIIRVKLNKMKAKALYRYVEKQDSPVKSVKCSFVWGETNIYQNSEKQLIFLVGFSSNLYTGILTKQEEEEYQSDSEHPKVRQLLSFQLKKRIKHYTSILFMGALYDHIFLICDFNNTFFMINARDLRLSFSKSISLTSLFCYKVEQQNLKISANSFNLDSFQLKAQRMVHVLSEKSDHIANAETNIDDFHRANSTLDFSSSGEILIQKYLSNRRYHTNSASFCIVQSTCYLLCEKQESSQSQFMRIQLRPWRYSLEQLFKQGEYLNAMHFLHSIYFGNHKFAFSTLPNYGIRQLLSPQIERAALNYIETILRHIREDPDNALLLQQQNSSGSSQSSQITVGSASSQIQEIKPFCDVSSMSDHDKIIFAIQFLQQCNEFDIIFIDIHRICYKVFKSSEFFVECLEPFILEGKITQVPNDVLAEIIDYYQQRGNLRVIQQVLTSLDLENLDTKPLIQLSMEKQLITALIYLSTRSSKPDFVTPLLIFWNSFVKSLRVWEGKLHGKSRSFIHDIKKKQISLENSGSTGKTTTVEQLNELDSDISTEVDQFFAEQIMLQQVNDYLKIRTEYEGLRALWYFRLCMEQRLIDGEFIGEEEFQHVTLSFDEWLSFSDNIIVCLQRWPSVFFGVLRVFFSEKPLKTLNRDQKKIKMYQQQYDAESMRKVTTEFCYNKPNALPSEYLLRLIIKTTLELDDRFDLYIRKQLERKSANSDKQQDEELQDNYYFYNKTEEQSDLSSYKEFVDTRMTSNQFDSLLKQRRDSLMSSFYVFIAYLIYESQCKDESTYLVGLFSFRSIKVDQIVFYLVQNPKALDQLEFSQEQLLKNAAMYAPLDPTCDYLELAQLLRSQFILSLIKKIYPGLTVTKRDDLSMMLELTDFATARSYVLHLREQYERAADCYFQSSNKIINKLVFQWMDLNLTQSKIESEDQFNLLQMIMKKKLPDLIRIDPERTHLLFQKFQGEAQQDIISKLSNSPNLQLLYITNIIKQYKLQILNDPNQVDRLKMDLPTLILHIQLMCSLNKTEDEILAEITSFDYYPYKVMSRQIQERKIKRNGDEEILDICQKKIYLEVCTHIHLKMGNPDLALRTQIRILDNTLRDYQAYLKDFCYRMEQYGNEGLQKPLNIFFRNDSQNPTQSFQFLRGGSQANIGREDENEPARGSMALFALGAICKEPSAGSPQKTNTTAGGEKVAKFNARIDTIVQKMWSICTQNKSYERPAENWFLLVDLLIETGQKYKEMEETETLSQMKKKFSQVLGATIMEISGQIEMADLLNKLRDSYNEISVADLKGTFCSLLKKSIESMNFLIYCLNYIQDDLLNLTETSCENFIRASYSAGHCASCLEPLHSLDCIRRKIRRRVIQNSGKPRMSQSSKSFMDIQDTSPDRKNSLIPENNCDDPDEEDEDQQTKNQIVVFFCGHSFHKECCFKQKGVDICTECIKAKNQLYFLMTLRRDLNTAQLFAFIAAQQEAIGERLIEQQSRATSVASNSSSFIIPDRKASSFSQRIEISEEGESEEISKFKRLKGLNKLRNFDKQQYEKYANLNKDTAPKKEKS